MEAGGLQDVTDDFVAETGLNFSFLFALYEGGSGNPADEDDCEAYHDTIGRPDFPVMADGTGKIAGATPIDQKAHPQMCALSADLEILGCYEGHGAHFDALDDIRDHAGL